MSPPLNDPPEEQALEQQEQRRYQERVERRLAPLDPETMAWLVLAPEWPEEVLRTAHPSMLERLRAALDSSGAPSLRPPVQSVSAWAPWKGDTFRIAPELRPDAYRRLVDRDSNFVSRLGETGEAMVQSGRFPADMLLRSELRKAGKAMLQSRKLPADLRLLRWAQLATHSSTDAALREYLDTQVTSALAAAGPTASDEALRWIEAAEFFTSLFPGKLELSLTIAKRRRELFQRQAYDLHMLGNYQRRDYQIQAFDDLLNDPNHWALHYAGMGGQGKTMLLRDLQLKYTGPTPFITTRVDFDYLNPDYPSRAPGLLLSALAEELRLKAGTDVTTVFADFDSAVTSLHDQVATTGAFPVDQGPFSAVIELFAKICRSFFPGDPADPKATRVVLMLDTCEELSKLRPDGTVPENVKVSFETLKLVVEKAANVRVVFSGRRALAQSGFEWEADSELPERDFLRLFVVQGFTDDEAARLLADFKVDSKPVPEKLRQPILDLTAKNAIEDQRFRRIVGNPPVVQSPPAPVARHNPYDLDLYAQLAASDPDLTPERLKSRHAYCEERILRRLNPDLRRLLPSIAAVGRFDRRLLEAIVKDRSAPATLCNEVILQEWVRADRAVALDKWLVEPPLRKLILEYYEQQEPAELREARASLALLLRSITLEWPFEQLAEQYFSATFEALQNDPETAAAWWMEVEQRILSENAWANWGQPLTSHLLADPLFEAKRPSLRAAVLATEAASIIHEGKVDASATWQRAEEAFARYPAKTGRAWLEFRIQCGVGAALGQLPLLTPAVVDPQLQASWLATAEALVEKAEQDGPGPYQNLRNILALGVSQLANQDPYLSGSLQSLQARLAYLASDPVEIEEGLFDAALEKVRHSPLGRQAWLDWRAPDNIQARILLEKERLTPPAPEERWTGIDLLPSIDSDRLYARRCAAGSSRPRRHEERSVTERPRCNAHRLIPPLEVVRREMEGRSDPLPALERLRQLSQQAKTAGVLDVSLQTDRSIARILLRQRLLTEKQLVPQAILDSGDPYDIWLRSAIRLLHSSGSTFEDRLKAMPEAPAQLDQNIPSGEALLQRLQVTGLRDHERESVAQYRKLYEAAVSSVIPPDTARVLLLLRLFEATRKARVGENLTEAVDGLQRLRLPASSWDEIRNAAQNDDPSFLEKVEPGWRPWIVRALAVEARAARPQKSQHPKRIVEWILRNQSVEVDGHPVLPIEVSFLERTPGIVDKFANMVALAFGYGLVGVVLLGLATFLWYFTGPGGFTGISGVLMHSLWAVLVALLGLLGIGLIGSFIQWLSKRIQFLSRIASPVLMEFRVELAEPPGDLNRPLLLPWKVNIRAQLFGIPLGRTMNPRSSTTEERYLYLYQATHPGQSESDQLVLRRISTLRLLVDVRIVVDCDSAGAPWEAVFGLPSPTETRMDRVPLRFSRTVSGRSATPQPDWGDSVTVSTWVYSGLGVERPDQSIRSWSWELPGRKTSLRVFGETLRKRADYESVRYQTGVAYIFGAPEQRASDVFLRLGGADSEDAVYRVAPTDIRRRYPNLRLLIVQAPPAEVHERSGPDRLQAAQLKRFGALAFQSGIPAVLVLPVLPLDLANQVPAMLLEVLRLNRRNAHRALVALTRRLQERVGAMASNSPEIALELAFDICLYVEDRVNFRIKTSPSAAGQLPTSNPKEEDKK